MDKIKNAIWFQLIVAVLNASLGCVNCVQLGIRRNQRIEAEKNDLSVEAIASIEDLSRVEADADI